MRTLILLLLLANLALFAWTQWLAPRSDSEPPATSRAAIPRFALVGEPPLALPAGAAAAVAAPAAASAPSAAAAPAASACVTVGPFANLEEAAKVTVVLKEGGYEPRQRPADGDVPDGYIVQVEGLQDAADQARVRRRLERGGLSDAFILPPADGQFAVSVGIFSDSRRAERRAAVVRKLRLSPVISTRTRPGTVYWLDLDLRTDGSGLTPESLQQSVGTFKVAPCPPPDAPP